MLTLIYELTRRQHWQSCRHSREAHPLRRVDRCFRIHRVSAETLHSLRAIFGLIQRQVSLTFPSRLSLSCWANRSLSRRREPSRRASDDNIEGGTEKEREKARTSRIGRSNESSPFSREKRSTMADEATRHAIRTIGSAKLLPHCSTPRLVGDWARTSSSRSSARSPALRVRSAPLPRCYRLSVDVGGLTGSSFPRFSASIGIDRIAFPFSRVPIMVVAFIAPGNWPEARIKVLSRETRYRSKVLRIINTPLG